MEKVQPDPLSRAFFALADPTRRAMLVRLAAGEATVSELMAPFALSQPTISKHLKVLEEMVASIEQGRDAQRRPLPKLDAGRPRQYRQMDWRISARNGLAGSTGLRLISLP